MCFFPRTDCPHQICQKMQRYYLKGVTKKEYWRIRKQAKARRGFTEHPERKITTFLQISNRSVRIYFLSDICDSAKGGFEAAVNLDILQKKFSHQGQFRALEFILASTLSDHQKGSPIYLKIKSQSQQPSCETDINDHTSWWQSNRNLKKTQFPDYITRVDGTSWAAPGYQSAEGLSPGELFESKPNKLSGTL